ncbi:hypothetical protein GDO86_011339 [Hymenochirus boettgeri]|uniref:Uncharacterized protein n=1 Tax=Hymenochirus boettgeri TaxID=247094 RepID=A0A8T2JB71_9PIPI|nr:hypothetical protein GDO86_011339 [Hymenochirus boettgeri]
MDQLFPAIKCSSTALPYSYTTAYRSIIAPSLKLLIDQIQSVEKNAFKKILDIHLLPYPFQKLNFLHFCIQFSIFNSTPY